MCGNDGENYRNECEAECKGVVSKHRNSFPNSILRNLEYSMYLQSPSYTSRVSNATKNVNVVTVMLNRETLCVEMMVKTTPTNARPNAKEW